MNSIIKSCEIFKNHSLILDPGYYFCDHNFDSSLPIHDSPFLIHVWTLNHMI